MQNNIRKPKLTVSDGLYRLDHPDSDIFLSRPVRTTSVRTLGDYIRHMQEVGNESDKSCFACQSEQSCQSNDCSGSHHATCCCTASDEQSCDKSCGKSSDNNCTDSFSDNLNYVHPNTINTNTVGTEKISPSPWPCVVVGAEGDSESDDKSVPCSNH